MNRLDWTGLVFTGLWVLGAAVILTGFSFCFYQAHRRGQRLRVWLAASSFRRWLWIGLFLIGLGAALLASHWWEYVLWGAFCAVSALRLWGVWRGCRGKGG